MGNSLSLSSGALPPVTIPALAARRARGERIAAVTCYDASFANLMNQCGVEALLVGDSLGMLCKGQDSTLDVTLEELVYHTRCVARGNMRALLISDLPFGCYGSMASTYAAAAQLMQAGAHMVKLEGGQWLADTVHFLADRAIPVCGHLGLMPQSVHQLGGYRIQGRTPAAATMLVDDARTLEAAGATLFVVEAVPAPVGKAITDAVTAPTIGIGAGPDCSGQVLVLHDLIGVYPGKKARFVRDFMEGQQSIGEALTSYVRAVKDGSFPGPEHCF
jgi:3-methyl-2-oxobutanoate hydroxymethyltransferase